MEEEGEEAGEHNGALVETVCVRVDPASFPWRTASTAQQQGSTLAHIQHDCDFAASTTSHTATQQQDMEALARAAALIRSGHPVAMPTETVYGLAASALSADAVKRIYAAKRRPADNPLIVHVSSLDMLQALYPEGWRLPDQYVELVARHWPGPLTILLPRSKKVPDEVVCGQPTMAVRLPAHPVARALIALSRMPLAAPSANRSGRPSPTLAAHVVRDLCGRVPLVLDGGACQSGVESTVLDALRSPPVVLRPGGVTVEQLSDFTNLKGLQVYRKHFVDAVLEQVPTTPGMKYRHYSPNAPIVLLDLADPAPAASPPPLANGLPPPDSQHQPLPLQPADATDALQQLQAIRAAADLQLRRLVREQAAALQASPPPAPAPAPPGPGPPPGFLKRQPGASLRCMAVAPSQPLLEPHAARPAEGAAGQGQGRRLQLGVLRTSLPPSRVAGLTPADQAQQYGLPLQPAGVGPCVAGPASGQGGEPPTQQEPLPTEAAPAVTGSEFSMPAPVWPLQGEGPASLPKPEQVPGHLEGQTAGAQAAGAAEPLPQVEVLEYVLGPLDAPGLVARELFVALRLMDDLGADLIVGEGVLEMDEGLAVMNRMRKAASQVVRLSW